jgi:hypothetical protein
MAREFRWLIDEVQVVRAMRGRRPAEPASVAQRGVERFRILVAALLNQSGDRGIEVLDERHEIDDRLGGHVGHRRRADVMYLRAR